MILELHQEPRTSENAGHLSAGCAGRAIVVSLATIAVLAVVFSAVGPFLGFGFRPEPIAVVFVAVSAAMLVVTYLITLIDDGLWAGIYMIVFWIAAMAVAVAMIDVFG